MLGTWAGEVVGEPVQDHLCSVFQSSHHFSSSSPDEDIQRLELFAGQARVSAAFARRKRGVLQPRDLRFGHDFKQEHHRSEVLCEIRAQQPKMVWMAPPCTYWCGFSRLNYEKQELRRLRAKEQVLVKFVNQVVEEQQARGRLFVVENPRNSDLWRHPLLQRWILQPGVCLAKADLCGYGMCNPDTGMPMKKPLSLLNNSMAFTEVIEQRCQHVP